MTDTERTYEYEIWRQKHGISLNYIATFKTQKETETFLLHAAILEISAGRQVADDEFGGFTTYRRNAEGKPTPLASYYVDVVLEEDDPDMPFEVARALFYARKKAGSDPRRYAPAQGELK